MNCERFERWLDDGRPGDESEAARAHARACPRCAAALDATLELEAALVSAPAAPLGFTDRVMARVAETPQVVPARAKTTPPAMAAALAMPWWVRAATDPAVLAATVLAGLIAGWGGSLVQILRGWEFGVAKLASFDSLAALAHDPRLALMAAIAIAPGLVWFSRRLYTWTEAFVSSRPVPGIPRSR